MPRNSAKHCREANVPRGVSGQHSSESNEVGQFSNIVWKCLWFSGMFNNKYVYWLTANHCISFYIELPFDYALEGATHIVIMCIMVENSRIASNKLSIASVKMCSWKEGGLCRFMIFSNNKYIQIMKCCITTNWTATILRSWNVLIIQFYMMNDVYLCIQFRFWLTNQKKRLNGYQQIIHQSICIQNICFQADIPHEYRGFPNKKS